MTPLHSAVQSGHTEIAKALIDGGATLNSADLFGIHSISFMNYLFSGQTPLHLAAMFGHTDTVIALITGRADVNKADNYGIHSISFSLSLSPLFSCSNTHAHTHTYIYIYIYI